MHLYRFCTLDRRKPNKKQPHSSVKSDVHFLQRFINTLIMHREWVKRRRWQFSYEINGPNLNIRTMAIHLSLVITGARWKNSVTWNMGLRYISWYFGRASPFGRASLNTHIKTRINWMIKAKGILHRCASLKRVKIFFVEAEILVLLSKIRTRNDVHLIVTFITLSIIG